MKIRYALAMAGMVSALMAAPAFAQQPSNVMSEADNTNSRWSPSVFDTQLGPSPDASPYYRDSGTRDAYMQEQRRRAAIERHELTRAQDPYYTVPDPYNAAPNPTRVEPSTSATNPTGNEPAGENSGGK